jgi:pyruvate dehydrogenase E2 component (dihydrolipoamide acetyltransferase)
MDGIEAATNTIELTVPELGDLGDRAVVAGWTKRVGERVTVDEPICRLAVGDLEFEVCSTADGEVTQIFADQGVGVLENTSLAQVRVDAPAEPVSPEPASHDAPAAPDDVPPSPKVESIEVEPLDPEFAPPRPGGDDDEKADADEPVVSIDQVEPIDPEFAPPQRGGDDAEEEADADEPVVKIEQVEPIDPEFAPPQPSQAERVGPPEPPVPTPSLPDPADPATGFAPDQPQADVAPPAGGLEPPAEPEAPPRADLPTVRPEPPSQSEPPSQPDPPGPGEPAPPTAAEPPAPGASELPSGDDVDWSGWISPVVQALADEHDLSLGEIRGTGIGGRIRKRDVLKYLESRDRGF